MFKIKNHHLISINHLIFLASTYSETSVSQAKIRKESTMDGENGG